MRFNELDEPKIGDILEVEIGDEIVETVIVGITESGDYLCETDSDAGMALLESRSDWDSNMPGYKGDYGGAENWGRRNREDDEHHEIDRQREQQLAQYNQSGNFWLKYKDSGKHINDQPYTGKAAANAAALMMIRSNPQVKGNLLITAYGPDESKGVTEGSTFPGPLSNREWSKVGRQIKSSQGRDSSVTSPHQRKDWYNPKDPRSSKQQKLDYLKSLKGSQGVAEAATPASVSKVLRLIQRHRSDWFDNYGMGEVEDTVVDMAEMGQFQGMSAEDALALVGQELESLYGQQGVAEGKYDRDEYYNARQGREYGMGFSDTGRGGSDGGQGREDNLKDQSKNLPADPFARTTGAVPKPKTNKNHRSVWAEDMEEGYTVTRGIDTERYQERAGLEGPFSAKNGKVVYYDKREGKYYDPDTDMYIEHDEWQAMNEAEYQGRKVPLGKPMQGDVAKSKVYVKNPQGNVVKVNFGDKEMRIKKSNPGRRKNFRARHNCDNPGPRHKARFWSCRAW